METTEQAQCGTAAYEMENSFSADYVTEKLLLAVQNSAVPVVLGGADYSRYRNMWHIAFIILLTSAMDAASKTIIIIKNGSAEVGARTSRALAAGGFDDELCSLLARERNREQKVKHLPAFWVRPKPRSNQNSLKGFAFDRDNGKPPPRNRYIFDWTVYYKTPFNKYMLPGNASFIQRNCSFANCFVTSGQSVLSNLTDYDVIIFNGPELYKMSILRRLPRIRSPKQKYIFSSKESSHYYPVKCPQYDGYFNWTWTYRLNSDIPNGYIIVRDSKNKVIAPSADVRWMRQTEMDPITEELKEKLKTKRKAAAWMVSNCMARSKREQFVKELRKELRKFWLSVDMFGECGGLACPKGQPICTQMIQRDYFFYLSFENSFSADYVTEKLLFALKNSAVPIVFGAANYSRYMPPGIYLDALELGPQKLAARMHELISYPEQYHDMFRWRNHYSYHAPHEAPDTDPLCKLCQAINDEQLMSETSIYEDFGSWWVPKGDGTRKAKKLRIFKTVG